MENEKREEIIPVAPQENLSVLDRAEATAKRIEEANKRTEELLNRQEQMLAKQILGGRADAGGNIQPKELEPREFAQKFLEGKINPYADKQDVQ